ncbi:hypothetical protein ZTR_11139 [Talaromyces verruculosus]|nr:hypothetical protein ZTR_11139 [Talaromyces verruculosus]
MAPIRLGVQGHPPGPPPARAPPKEIHQLDGKLECATPSPGAAATNVDHQKCSESRLGLFSCRGSAFLENTSPQATNWIRVRVIALTRAADLGVTTPESRAVLQGLPSAKNPRGGAVPRSPPLRRRENIPSFLHFEAPAIAGAWARQGVQGRGPFLDRPQHPPAPTIPQIPPSAHSPPPQSHRYTTPRATAISGLNPHLAAPTDGLFVSNRAPTPHPHPHTA